MEQKIMIKDQVKYFYGSVGIWFVDYTLYSEQA